MRKQDKPVLRNTPGRISQACVYCGRIFETIQSQVKRGNGKYCKRECWMAARLATQEGRVCTTCGIYKTADEFGVNPQHPPRLRSHCKNCRSLRERAKRESDPGLANRLRRAALLRQYGITIEEYEQLAETQGLACAICGSKEAGSGHSQLLVDHDHATGRVRGLLCNNCNIGIANFRDNTDYLQAAISYLDKQK